MVSKSSNQHSSVKPKTGVVLFLTLMFIFVFVLSYIVCSVFFIKKPDDQPITEPESEVMVPPEEPDPVLPDEVNFQDLVDEWANSVDGNRSVLIYDLERDEMVASYNPDENYNTASLYKLFVVYNGYQKLTSGEWNADDMAGGTGHTILECLDLAIRESYSPCAETLWAMIGRDNLDEIILNDYNIKNSHISSLISNPQDILEIMKIFYHHDDITDENLIARMKDSFLNQPITTYNWRQGLPSGFSRANVYNKVGWAYNAEGKYWDIYHDTAIVEFPEDNRHFIVVVMTNRVPFQKISELGTMIENAYYQ